jgi:hypothetical protein
MKVAPCSGKVMSTGLITQREHRVNHTEVSTGLITQREHRVNHTGVSTGLIIQGLSTVLA